LRMSQIFCIFVRSKHKLQKPIYTLMKHDLCIFSEISKFFKNEDSNSAMYAITDCIKALSLKEQQLFSTKSKHNCKVTQLQILQLLLMYPCFMVANAYNYVNSSLYKLVQCQKDVFYRFLSNETYNWRKILSIISIRLWKKTRTHTERISNSPICLMVDDTDFPKTGLCAEKLGKVFSHIEHKMIAGYKGLFLGITDGISQMLLDFCLLGEKGKNGTYSMTQRQLDKQFSKEHNEQSSVNQRIKEYDESKIKLVTEMIKRMIKLHVHFDYILADSWFACTEIIQFVTSRHIKCHYLGMIKMGKTKYRYKGKDYTAKQLIAHLRSKEGCSRSRKLHCQYLTADVLFAGRNVRLFFVKRNNRTDWNGLITTNTALPFIEAYQIYSMRWSLEVVFKDCKSNLGLGKYQVRNFASQIACTAITATQYNILSVAKRFSNYETIGGLFREATRNSTELTITERIWGLIQEIITSIVEAFGIDDNQAMDAIINHSENIKHLLALYPVLQAS